MSKNNNVIQLFFYSVICLSIGFLIYNSCKSKIVEGFTESKDPFKPGDDSSEGEQIKDFTLAVFEAGLGPTSSKSAGGFTWKNDAAKAFSASPLITSLPWIKNNMDISNNLNSTLTYLQDSKEVLRLMGINEMAVGWDNTNPEFINFYKEKMFFLDDLEKYIQQFCMKTGTNCSGTTSVTGGNWWTKLTGGGSEKSGDSGDSGKSGDNWFDNLSKDAKTDWTASEDYFKNTFNNMNKK